MKKIILSVVTGVLVLGLGTGAFLIYSQGKADDEETNISDDMSTVDRSEEEAVTDDSLVFQDTEVAYSLPDNFYLEYEYPELEHGNMKDYMDHNYTTLIDVYIYETYVGDVGIIGDSVENSYVYHDITIDADEWIREMEMTYLETEDTSLIREEQVNGRNYKYVVKYNKNKDGVMQGTLAAVTPLEDGKYYCVRLVEFDKDSEPDFNNYRGLFEINVK